MNGIFDDDFQIETKKRAHQTFIRVMGESREKITNTEQAIALIKQDLLNTTNPQARIQLEEQLKELEIDLMHHKGALELLMELWEEAFAAAA